MSFQFLYHILNRYLTESYGTGQDIDDRIVEGIVNFKNYYFMLLDMYERILSKWSGIFSQTRRILSSTNLCSDTMFLFNICCHSFPSTSVNATKMAGMFIYSNFWCSSWYIAYQWSINSSGWMKEIQETSFGGRKEIREVL